MNANSFLARLFKSSAHSAAADEAVALAAALESQPNICRWLITGIAASPRESTRLLVRAAQTLRDELHDFATASMLERLARNPRLLMALIRELRRIERSTFTISEAKQTHSALSSAIA